MGTPDFAVPTLELLAKNFNISLVVTTPDKQAGRGLKLQPSPIKLKALELQLPIAQPISLKDPSFVEQLRDINPDFIVVVAFRIVPNEILSIPKYGTINLHPSLLPKYRGPSPIQWAIINDEKITGVTTILLNDQIDGGPILLQNTEPIYDTDNFESLHNRLKIKGAQLVIDSIIGLVENTINPKKQEQIYEQEKIYAPKITKEICKLDLNKSCKYNWRVVRALSPKPAAFVYLINSQKNNLVLKIFDAEYKITNSMPGQFIILDKNTFAIGCSDGILIPKTLALEGRKTMSNSDCLRGLQEKEKLFFQ